MIRRNTIQRRIGFDWLFGDSWPLEVLDPEGPSSVPIDGIPKNGDGYYASRFDDVTRVLIPGDGYTSTTVYSLTPEGRATEELYTEGWATRLYRLPLSACSHKKKKPNANGRWASPVLLLMLSRAWASSNHATHPGFRCPGGAR